MRSGLYNGLLIKLLTMNRETKNKLFTWSVLMISCSLLVIPLPEFLSFFRLPLVIAFSYFFLHNDSSRFWYFYCFFNRIVSRYSSRQHLWRECYGSHADCLYIVSISPSDKSFSHVANDVICSANTCH